MGRPGCECAYSLSVSPQILVRALYLWWKGFLHSPVTAHFSASVLLSHNDVMENAVRGALAVTEGNKRALSNCVSLWTEQAGLRNRGKMPMPTTLTIFTIGTLRTVAFRLQRSEGCSASSQYQPPANRRPFMAEA